MILYMFERKLNRIIFKIQYYGPGWYEKKKRKYDPYIDRYFRYYINKYIEISDNWPLWLKIIVPPLSLMVLWTLPKLVSLIVAIVYPYYTFFCTVLDIYIGPIILFLKWLFYYPVLFLDWLTSTLKHIRYTATKLTKLVVNQGIIASIKFIYFLVANGITSGVKEIYSIVVLSEDGWLHHLAPDFEVLIGRFKMVYFWLKRRWLSLLIYYMFFSLLRRLWRWYIYKVPNMSIEWFVDRGPTMLFIYQLRVCPFKEIWPIYKEQVYEFIFGTFMFFGYIFHMPILAFIKRYLRNIDGFRYTLKKRIKRKIRKPIFRILVRFHLLFLPFYYFIQHVFFFYETFFYLFTFGFSRLLLVIAILLLISFFWLNFHKFFFDYFLFFILNKFGFRFPRSTLYTQSVQVRAGDLYPIRKKIKSSLVSLRLNSLVDLKNTNVYSVYSNKLFSQLPFSKSRTLPKYLDNFANLFRLLRISRKKYRSKKYGFTSFGVRDSGVSYRPFGLWSPRFGKPRAEIRLRMSAPDTWRHFHLMDKFNLLHYSSLLRYSRFKGSVFLPKFISNKFDFNTLVLKELLLLCYNSALPSGPDNCCNNYQVLNANNSLEFFNSTNNLSVPSLDLFGKSDFFLFDRNFNKISARKPSLLSDLCYSFLGRFNFKLSKNPTFFYDTPIYRHRTGGNFRYKNVYSYNQRSIINSFKFLNNFKISASFPRKRIRIYNPYNRTKHKAGGLLKRYFKFNRITKALPNYPMEGSYLRILRSMFRRVDFKNSCRLIRQFAALRLRKKRRLNFDFIDQVVSLRSGSAGQRKFIYRRFIYNKFSRSFSFYKKRQKIHFGKFVKNPKIAFVIKHKFSANRGRIVSPGVISKPVVNRLSFRSFSSNLKSLRRNIVFLLRYKNKRKFFKHGTKFLIRSQLFSKKNQINKGRQLRRFFTKNNTYLSFLKSIYSRNIRLLLAVKSVSSLISNSLNKEFSYLPLFHVLEKPWWHGASLKNKNFSYFNFYSGARSAKGKLGFTNHNNFNAHFNLSKQSRRYFGRWIMSNRLLAKRYCPNRFGWAWRRRSTSIPYVFSDWRTTYWGRRFRIKNWFYKNYKVVPSILFINPAKDNRRFAFDYVFKYFHEDDVDLSLKTAFASAPSYGGFGPLLLRSTFDFKFRYRYLRKLFFGTLFYYLNSLYFIFFFCLIFYSFPSDIQPYLF